MPVAMYLCTNSAAGCLKALGRERIEIEEGQEALCPDCGWALEPVRPIGLRIVPKWILAVAALVVVIGLGIWLFMPSSHKPNPDAADKKLSEFYPQLPPK